MATTQVLQPGESATVTLHSEGAISSEFAGDTLSAVFAVPSGASASTKFTVAATPANPAAPTDVHQISATSTSVTIGWTDAQSVASYQLWHVVNGQPTTILKTVPGTQKQATITGLMPGYPETLAVRAVLAKTLSPFSAPFVAHTQA